MQLIGDNNGGLQATKRRTITVSLSVLCLVGKETTTGLEKLKGAAVQKNVPRGLLKGPTLNKGTYDFLCDHLKALSVITAPLDFGKATKKEVL